MTFIEAAKVDGASKWDSTLHVVVPHLMPLVSFRHADAV